MILKVFPTHKSRGRVHQSSTALFLLCTALTLVSKSMVIPIEEVEYGFVITRVQRVLNAIVSLDVSNMLILYPNKSRHLTDINIQFLY